MPSIFRGVGEFIPLSNMDHEWFINADSGPESGFGGARARNRTSRRGNPFETEANTESGRGTAEGETPEPEGREDAVFNILRQNADVMRMMREEREDARRAEAERTELLLGAIHRLTRDRQVAHANPAVNNQATVRKLTSFSLGLLPEFNGEGMQAANEWVEKIEELGVSYGWSQSEHRQAACTKLVGSAMDWHLAVGKERITWPGWRQSFLVAFGRPLTMDQFVEMARGRVRAPNESISCFCYAMQRICARSPIQLDERSIIRYMLLGLNDAGAENALVTAQPNTLENFYELVRSLEMHRVDRGAISQVRPHASHSSFLNVSQAETPSDSSIPGVSALRTSTSVPPPRDPFSIILERMDKIETEIRNVSARQSFASRSFSTPAHQGTNSLAGWRTSTPANMGPPPSAAALSPRRGPQSPGRSIMASPSTRSVSFGTTTFADPRTCFSCGKRGHIQANCPEVPSASAQNITQSEN